MTTQEKRFLRRELINYWLKIGKGIMPINQIISLIRLDEIKSYGLMLNIYSQYVKYHFN